MDNQTTQKIQDLLSKHDKIGILVGKNPQLDQMAAALSLGLSLQKAGKQVTVACPTEPIVAISSLVGIDRVKTSLDGTDGDLIVSFPYREGEIEKVSYTLENNYLNIVVKASDQGLSFNEREVVYKRSGGLPNLLFVVGTQRLSDLGNLFNADGMKDTTLVNIDARQDNQGFGDVVLVSAKSSSVSEQVANLLTSLNLSIDTDIAQNLLSGISFETDNFQKQKTSYLAFEMAGMLMRKGALRTQSSPERVEPVRDMAFQPVQQQPRNDRPDRNTNNKRSWIDNLPQQAEPKQILQPQPVQQPQSVQQQQQMPKQQPQQQPRPVVAAQQPQQFQPKPIQQPKPQQPETPVVEETPPDWLTPKVYKSSTLI